MDIITLTLAKKYAREKITEAESLGWHKAIVDELPSNPDNYTIYLVKDGDLYKEYIWDQDASNWIYLCTIGEVTADKNYTHIQATPATDLTIHHNLNKQPSLDIVNQNGSKVLADATYIDNNTVSLTFNPPFTGTITFN